jgi:hypothetical protein
MAGSNMSAMLTTLADMFEPAMGADINH